VVAHVTEERAAVGTSARTAREHRHRRLLVQFNQSVSQSPVASIGHVPRLSDQLRGSNKSAHTSTDLRR